MPQLGWSRTSACQTGPLLVPWVPGHTPPRAKGCLTACRRGPTCAQKLRQERGLFPAGEPSRATRHGRCPNPVPKHPLPARTCPSAARRAHPLPARPRGRFLRAACASRRTAGATAPRRAASGSGDFPDLDKLRSPKAEGCGFLSVSKKTCRGYHFQLLNKSLGLGKDSQEIRGGPILPWRLPEPPGCACQRGSPGGLSRGSRREAAENPPPAPGQSEPLKPRGQRRSNPRRYVRRRWLGLARLPEHGGPLGCATPHPSVNLFPGHPVAGRTLHSPPRNLGCLLQMGCRSRGGGRIRFCPLFHPARAFPFMGL